VLNVQPLLSTTAAVLLFGDRLAPTFPPWALLAVASGMVLIGLGPDFTLSFDAGTGYALLTALCWGMSTVAGRAVMVDMSLPLAAGLRVMIGLVAMTVLVASRGLFTLDHLWPAAAPPDLVHAVLHAVGLAALWPVEVPPDATHTVLYLVALASLSGWVPLLFYFRGLALTRASTAGYFEMMQTLAAVAITWGLHGKALEWWQVIAAILLIVAVAMVQRAQERTVASD
jgi:drug/metabolite transporter (DMT)-like permease